MPGGMFKRWPQKYINTLVHVYYLEMFQHVLGFQNDRFLNCYLQDCKYNRSSWEKYFNHSWVYGNFKTFFITRARVDWKQATTYLMAQCMYYVFNKFQQIPEMAQLLKIEVPLPSWNFISMKLYTVQLSITDKTLFQNTLTYFLNCWQNAR